MLLPVAASYSLQSLSYVSPRALVNALLPGMGGAGGVAQAADGSSRVAAFKRYIAGGA